VPLRSVEAATRDDAIAAAREQFGPSARVVGVRRVRSGGVLGFFATERYVAEVANDPSGRPAVPVTSRAQDDERAEEPAAGYNSSPLSAAAPATAASSAAARSRAAAPSRNGASAWAAAAGPSAASPSSSSPASRVDDDRVSELAGLLGAEPAPAAPATLYGRSSFPRTPAPRPTTPVVFPTEKPEDDDNPFVEDYVASRPLLRVDDVAAGPSPFTAALARMVSGDRDVREAVESALDKPAVKRTRTDVDASAPWPVSRRTDETSVPPRPARQEEETVGDQVIAPPSPVAPLAAELPNWAVEPEAAPIGSPREEAIAEVLRSALAQGHSDEALAGILRKVLAGDSPQTALSTPVVETLAAPLAEYVAPEQVATPEPSAPATMSLAMALAGSSQPEPVAEAAVETPAAVFATPVVEAPVVEAAVVETSVVELPTDAIDLPAENALVIDDVEATADAALDAPLETPGYEVFETVEEPIDETPAYEAPAYLTPGYEIPAYEVPVFQLPPVLAPASFESPSSIWGSAADSIWGPSIDSIWGGGTSSETPLWGNSGPNRPAPLPVSDAPIWDSVTRDEQAAAEATVQAEEALPVFDALAMPAADDDLFAEPTVDAELDSRAEDVVDEGVETEADVRVDPEESSAVIADEAADEEVAVLAPVLARTASDPAPMSLDSTTVMPPLSLLPPLPGSRPSRGRPPVPPTTSRRSISSVAPHAPSTAPMSAPTAAPSVGTAGSEAAAETSDRSVEVTQVAEQSVEAPLATVTRLSFAPAIATPETPEVAELSEPQADVEVDEAVETADAVETVQETAEPEVVEVTVVPDMFAEVEPIVDEAETIQAETVDTHEAETVAPVAVGSAIDETPVVAEPIEAAVVEAAVVEPAAADLGAAGIIARLEGLGVPGHLLGADFDADVRAQGTYAALTRALGLRLPKAPELPTGAGDVLVVIGPGVETLRAARSLAAAMRLDPDRVQWATRGDLAGLAPKASRVTTVEAAIDRRQDVAHDGTVTIVAVDAPMRTDAYWTAQMLAVWSPTAVWAVVEATRKPEDLGPWIDGLPRVDALMVLDTDLSADPAAVLRRVAAPVAMIDGVRATPHRWASVLCERLESARP
jgi:hypothetical protein